MAEATHITCVTLERVDGKQTRLDPDESIWDAEGNRIGLEDVKGALEGGPYIEFETEARWEPHEVDEPWRQSEPGDWQEGRVRLYGRHVVELMEVYG